MLLHSKILGKGQPLLILHGLLGMGDNWISLGRQYADKGFEVHLIDLRNHGKSFHSDDMTYEAMTDDLIHYINKQKLDQIHLIGHSMGGKTAMNFVLANPDVTQKIIVVDIAPKYYPPHHHFIFDAIKQLDLYSIKTRKDAEQILSEKIDSKAIVQFILKNLGRHQDGRYFWKPNIEVLENSLKDLGEALPPMAISHIKSLFIKGGQSPYILPEDYPLIKAHFPNAEIINIPNSGHWVHSQAKNAFFNHSFNFLTKP